MQVAVTISWDIVTAACIVQQLEFIQAPNSEVKKVPYDPESALRTKDDWNT